MSSLFFFFSPAKRERKETKRWPLLLISIRPCVADLWGPLGAVVAKGGHLPLPSVPSPCLTPRRRRTPTTIGNRSLPSLPLRPRVHLPPSLLCFSFPPPFLSSPTRTWPAGEARSGGPRISLYRREENPRATRRSPSPELARSLAHPPRTGGGFCEGFFVRINPIPQHLIPPLAAPSRHR